MTKLKKSSSPEPLSQFQPILAQSIIGWGGFKFLLKKKQSIILKLLMFSSSLNQRYDIIICVYWFELFSQVNYVAHGPLVVFMLSVWFNFFLHMWRLSLSQTLALSSFHFDNILMEILSTVGVQFLSEFLSPFHNKIYMMLLFCKIELPSTCRIIIYKVSNKFYFKG